MVSSRRPRGVGYQILPFELKQDPNATSKSIATTRWYRDIGRYIHEYFKTTVKLTNSIEKDIRSLFTDAMIFMLNNCSDLQPKWFRNSPVSSIKTYFENLIYYHCHISVSARTEYWHLSYMRERHRGFSSKFLPAVRIINAVKLVFFYQRRSIWESLVSMSAQCV